MTPTRKRRLIIVSLILAAVAAAASLTVLALQQNMTYLHSPSEVLGSDAPPARFRLGGVVLEESIHRADDSLQVDFVVTDRYQQLPVRFTGILPDLFREGQSIVATGSMQDGAFHADEVLAKHDETYMPKEVADAIAKAKDVPGAKPH